MRMEKSKLTRWELAAASKVEVVRAASGRVGAPGGSRVGPTAAAYATVLACVTADASPARAIAALD